jgi:hypothetical protein
MGANSSHLQLKRPPPADQSGGISLHDRHAIYQVRPRAGACCATRAWSSSAPTPQHANLLEQAAHAAASALVASRGPIRVDGASAPQLARQGLPGSSTLRANNRPSRSRKVSIPANERRGWLEQTASLENYDRYFEGLMRDSAMFSLGATKADVAQLKYKLKVGGTVGGYWDATINALQSKDVREALQIMGKEKRAEETEFYVSWKGAEKRLKYEAYIYAAGVAGVPILVEGGSLLAGEGLIASGAGRAAPWVAPRATAWAGLHPALTTGLVYSGLTLGEDYSQTGTVDPLNLLIALLHVPYNYEADVSFQRSVLPSGSSDPASGLARPPLTRSVGRPCVRLGQANRGRVPECHLPVTSGRDPLSRAPFQKRASRTSAVC